MARNTKTLMTVEEFERLPDDDVRRELVRGEVVETTPAGVEHSALAVKLAAALAGAAGNRGLVVGADCGFILAEDPPTVRAPDSAFVRSERFPGGQIPRSFFPGAPDLAVEVISPDDTMTELLTKITEYLDAGTQIVWLVVPQRREVYVYRPNAVPEVVSADGCLTADPVLPGLSLPVAQIFAR